MHQSAPHHCRALLPRASSPLRPCSAITERLRLPFPLPLTPSGSPSPLSLQPRACARASARQPWPSWTNSIAAAAPSPAALQRRHRAVPWMRVVPPVLALPFSSARRRRRSPAEDGRGHSRLLTWPGGHGPPLVALRPASGVPRRRGPRRPLPRRRQTLAVRHRAFPAILLRLLCKSRPGASYDNSMKIKGLTAMSLTQVNSAVRTGL